MDFSTIKSQRERETEERAKIEGLKAEVAHKDANPLVPGDQYMGGDMYDGFFAGMIIAANDTHVAIWSKLAGRVAILPTRGIADVPAVGTIVAMHSWGSRVRRCVPITATYGWLDAFDDFIVAFQRSDRDWRMSLANDGLCGDIFALNAKGDVASWYRDRVAYNAR